MRFIKLPEATANLIMSTCPSSSVKQRLPRDKFSWNLIFTYFSKIYRENTSFITIPQEWRVLYMQTFVYFLLYLSQLFLGWEMFQTKFIEFYVWFSVHHKLKYIKNERDATWQYVY
jgi:hypothetical protein